MPIGAYRLPLCSYGFPEYFGSMAKGKVIWKLTVALSLAASSILAAEPAHAGSVGNKRVACLAVKKRLAAFRHYPMEMMAYCDVLSTYVPRGYYVMAIHSRRACEGICSTNMGWFAIHKATGRVFEWDVTEDRPGPEVAG